MEINLKTAFFKTMEELSVVGLAHRKESAAPLTGEARGEELGLRVTIGYPLAVVLRLRVLQIVCGISAMVMGSVAYIEERKESNLFLGIPAGAFTVVAAALSIHTSRGWGSGPGGAGNMGCVGLAAALWLAACSLLLALLVQCARTILDRESLKPHPTPSDPLAACARDLLVLAGVQAALAAAALAAAFACAALDAAA